MEKLIANLSKKVRRETLNGREHFVAPLTLIVPGVLNGSKGPLYYPAEEITKDPSIWNHMPIVVNHPTTNGNPVSARSSEVLNSFGIGLVLNAKGSDSKLVAEGWFDVENTRRINSEIHDSLANNRSIELSTGLFTDNEQAPDGATFNNVPYTHIARNHRPDHLAILTDSVGACSIQDGCGVFNEAADWLKLLEGKDSLLLNQPSHNMIREILNKLLQESRGSDTFIVEIFDNFLIYEASDGKLWKIKYTIDKRSNKKIKLSTEQPKEVVRTVTYKPVTNEKRGNVKMAFNEKQKKEIIDGLISNACCWKDEDRETLEGLTDNTLENLVEQNKKIEQAELVANAAETGFEDEKGNSHKYNSTTNKWETTIKQEEKEPVKNEGNKKDPKPQTTEEWFKSAPEEVRNTLKYAQDIENKEKALIVEKLVANLDDEAGPPMTKNLLTKTLEELRGLATLLPEKEPERVMNYTGAASPATNQKSTDRGPGLPMPDMDFTQK